MAIGMGYDEFWEEDACRVIAYREAYKIKNRMRNQEMWIQGAYIYQVLGAFAPILPAFPAKGAKPGPYCDILPITQEEQRQKEEEEQRRKYEQMKERTRQWARSVNSTKGGES